ncbi:hypothetical protein PhCBS80983_g01834 [Powellomyces hirtus]|uniref:Nuclear receptor 2C2-associated protein n=1 Tax=Powellomyces hirtus TaxID=109895 RepID=A0A507E8L3_9FUNG|nr:hypothetical protein PhCBS80983_g01834 [Powellomyces hirtus]
MSSLLDSDTKIRVSSTLNRDVKSYGKQFLTDNSDETCWNSDQGTPQHIAIDFGSAVKVQALHFMFQGGFTGKECEIVGVNNEGADDVWEKVVDFYPEDQNHLQVFPLPTDVAAAKSWKRLRIVFKNSTDFYGRVTVYRLDVLGERL